MPSDVELAQLATVLVALASANGHAEQHELWFKGTEGSIYVRTFR